MLSEELAAVRCDLEDFAAEMFEPFARADQRRWGEVYLRGLLLDGRRKSVEPMAARLGEDGNRQALAHFITTSPLGGGARASPSGVADAAGHQADRADHR
ncbi:hypothetical protein GCM10020295_00350 [Streptomyces cinereospinus]